MNKKEFCELVKKVSDGEATDQEIAVYNRYYNEYQKAGESWDYSEMGDEQAVHAKLTERIQSYIKPVPVISLWNRKRKIAAAAAILILLSTAVYIFSTKPLIYNTNIGRIANTGKDIAPGSNKAILKLTNGQVINLSDANNGTLAEQAGMGITKSKDGQLVYKATSSADHKIDGNVASNAISTPKGGQYQIILSDGSRIWLNASSSLKFPATFAHATQRKVELTGEAYFEVAKDKNKPFRVSSHNQTVEVLGTHFNINSYTDEPDTKTTLLEGSVRVLRQAQHDSNIILRPGEQSINSGFAIRVDQADIESAVAWKNGKFKFVNENIRDLMRKIARWYDVDVTYQGEMTNKDFSGSVSRFDHISKILDVLESTNTVHFKIEGRRVTVMP